MKNKLMNKIIPTLLLVVMLVSIVPTAVFAVDTVIPPVVDEPAGHADLRVEELETQLMTQGKNNQLIFQVDNANSATAKAVKISASGEGDFASKFTIVDGTNTYVAYDYIYSKKRVQTDLKIDADVPDGVYKLNIKFEYKSVDGVESTPVVETCIIYVNGSSESKPYVESVSFDKEEIGKDNKVVMTANLVNPTQNKYNNVKLALRTSEIKDFTLFEEFQPAYVPWLEPKSTTKIEFSVYVASSVTTGNYPIAFDLSFNNIDSDTNLYSYTCPLFAQVKRSADADASAAGSTPRIIVSQYKTDVEQIQAGKSFKLDFTLENTSNTNVGNMKVTIGSAVVAASGTGTSGGGSSGDVFFPVAGSNSFFIETLNAKQTVSKQIELMAKQDVEPGVYQVVLDIQYEDNSAKAFSSEENIAFNVLQDQRLEIIGVNVPPDAMPGQPAYVSFQYINKGKATIYNMTVSADGDFTLEGGDMYIGNLPAGFNDYFDGAIVPNGDGEQKGALLLKFEDSQGNPKEIRHDVTMNVMAMGDMSGDGGMDGNMGGNISGGIIGGGDGMIGGGMIDPETGEMLEIDPETGFPVGMMIDPETGELVKMKGGIPWLIIIICAVVLGVGAFVYFFVIRKKIKAKKELLLDEED